MRTGYLESDKDRHQVEIQLHLNCLLKLRSMGGSVGGGHRLYATYRSLEEALKVAYGQRRVTETIEKRGQTSPHPRPLPKRPKPRRERSRTPPRRERSTSRTPKRERSRTPPRRERSRTPPRRERSRTPPKRERTPPSRNRSNPRKKSISIDIASPTISVMSSAPPMP